jgi:hypothetical protein
MTKRLEILSQIMEDEKIRKMAQEIGTEVVDQSAADKLATDIFDKLFNEEVQKLIQES